MPIITSTILRKDGTPFVGFVRFTPWWSTPPASVDDMQPLNSVTSNAGKLSQRVKAGYYRVEVGLNPAVMILVPDNVADDAQLELTTTIVGPNYAPAGSGSSSSFLVYFGKFAGTSMTQNEILASLGNRSTSTIAGIYTFAADAGKYCFFAFPDSAGSPRVGNGFMLGNFTVPMAGAAEGYDQIENGWSYKLVTVDGVSCRLYRTFYVLGGGIDITVNK